MAGYRKLRSHISPDRFMKVLTHVPLCLLSHRLYQHAHTDVNVAIAAKLWHLLIWKVIYFGVSTTDKFKQTLLKQTHV